jgi:hypothetical protein
MARYLGVTLDTRLTCSAHINQVGRKAAQKLGVLCYFTSGSYVLRWTKYARSGGLLPTAMSGSCKCYNPSIFTLRPTHLGNVDNSQIHQDLGIPFFADHIWALTESFDSKLYDEGNPLVRQLGRPLLTSTKGCLKSLTVNRRGRIYSRPVEATPIKRPSRRSAQYPPLLSYPD